MLTIAPEELILIHILGYARNVKWHSLSLNWTLRSHSAISLVVGNSVPVAQLCYPLWIHQTMNKMGVAVFTENLEAGCKARRMWEISAQWRRSRNPPSTSVESFQWPTMLEKACFPLTVTLKCISKKKQNFSWFYQSFYLQIKSSHEQGETVTNTKYEI